jgi:nitrite reductase/ring-hydroxylating ferredoxin subunit/uncharacterized membrane protein
MSVQEVLPHNPVAQAGDAVTSLIEQQSGIDAVSDALDKVLSEGLRLTGEAGQWLKDFLNGRWFGHPIHPPLTDVPVGAWTATLVFDALDAVSGRKSNGYGKVADATLKVGIVGAIGAALAGLADWQDLQPSQKRVGTVHGLLNSAALVSYLASLGLRKRGDRGTARLLSTLGYCAVLGSAYLGGHLIFRQRAGVDHSQTPESDHFVPVMDVKDLTEDTPRLAKLGDIRIVLVRHQGQIYALSERCAHQGGPLSEGKMEGDALGCPWHGSRFCVRDGQPVNGPASAPQPTLQVRVRDGKIEARS